MAVARRFPDPWYDTHLILYVDDVNNIEPELQEASKEFRSAFLSGTPTVPVAMKWLKSGPQLDSTFALLSFGRNILDALMQWAFGDCKVRKDVMKRHRDSADDLE